MKQRSARRFLLSALVGVSSLIATAADAASVHFVTHPLGYAIGFDPDDPIFGPSADYALGSGVTFVGASDSDPTAPIQLLSSHDCELLDGSPCPSDIAAGTHYRDSVTLTIASVQDAIPEEGILLFISVLRVPPQYPSAPPYSPDDVSVVLDSGLDDLASITYLSAGGLEGNYLGWLIHAEDVGTRTLRFQYEVLGSGMLDVAGNASTPWIGMNAVYAVPEPTTALLLAIGLGGLAIRRRR